MFVLKEVESNIIKEEFENTRGKHSTIEGEGVGTSTIRTSTGQKFKNIKMVFLVDQNIENQKDQNVENVF